MTARAKSTSTLERVTLTIKQLLRCRHPLACWRYTDGGDCTWCRRCGAYQTRATDADERTGPWVLPSLVREANEQLKTKRRR